MSAKVIPVIAAAAIAAGVYTRTLHIPRDLDIPLDTTLLYLLALPFCYAIGMVLLRDRN
jgi:hypothetical protein